MKNKKIIQFFLLIVLLILLPETLLSCSEPPKPSINSIQPLDTSKAVAVKARFSMDQELASEKIDVSVKNDTATLSGTVHSEEVKERASALTLKTRGINKVINNLQVLK